MLKFKLTEKHIRSGEPNMLFNCPFSLCIAEGLGLEIGKAFVMPPYVGLNINDQFHMYRIPKEMDEAIRLYDRNLLPSPMEFQIDNETGNSFSTEDFVRMWKIYIETEEVSTMEDLEKFEERGDHTPTPLRVIFPEESNDPNTNPRKLPNDG